MALVLLLVGPALIVVGSVFMGIEADLRHDGIRVQGVVTEVETGPEASQRNFRVAYEANGAPYAMGVEGLFDHAPTPGQEMTVIYRSSDPGDAVVEGYDGPAVSVAGVGLVLTVVLGFVAVMMLASLRSSSKRARRSG